MGSEKGDDIEGGREEGRKEEEIIRGGGGTRRVWELEWRQGHSGIALLSDT